MYKPLPKELTIKKSPIEGLGLYAQSDIKANCFIGLTHIQDRNFENGYIRRANYELGSIYGFSAKVIHGAGRGKKMKFPTANLLPIEKKQLLAYTSNLNKSLR